MSAWTNVAKHVGNTPKSLIYHGTPVSSGLSINATIRQKHGKSGFMRRKGSGITKTECSDDSTAFCIYLLDCGYVLFFGDRPRIAPYELRHSLPAHEHVYEARTAFEWQ